MATSLLTPKVTLRHRSTLNFGYWLVIGCIGWVMLALVTNVGTVLGRLPLYESIPLAILVLGLTGIVLKMARDEWWIHYLERQTQYYIGHETVTSWCTTIDSMWLIRKTMRRELRLLYRQLAQTKASEEVKQILALQLVERGVLIVYSCPKSDHPA